MPFWRFYARAVTPKQASVCGLGMLPRIASGVEGLGFRGIGLGISRINLARRTKLLRRLPVLAEFHPAGAEVETPAQVLGIHLDGPREILGCFRIIAARKIDRAKDVVSKAVIRQGSGRFLEVSQRLVVVGLRNRQPGRGRYRNRR